MIKEAYYLGQESALEKVAISASTVARFLKKRFPRAKKKLLPFSQRLKGEKNWRAVLNEEGPLDSSSLLKSLASIKTNRSLNRRAEKLYTPPEVTARPVTKPSWRVRDRNDLDSDSFMGYPPWYKAD